MVRGFSIPSGLRGSERDPQNLAACSLVVGKMSQRKLAQSSPVGRRSNRFLPDSTTSYEQKLAQNPSGSKDLQYNFPESASGWRCVIVTILSVERAGRGQLYNSESRFRL